MTNKKVIDDNLKRSLQYEDQKKVKETAKRGAFFWIKVYNSLCDRCRSRALNITRNAQLRNRPNPLNPDKDFCVRCKEYVKSLNDL